MKTARRSSYYLFFVCCVYLAQCVYCWVNISEEDFKGMYKKEELGIDFYNYSVEIERMKFVHALCLLFISGYIVGITVKYKILNEKHYYQLLTISVVITLIYFLPVVWWCGKLWDDARHIEG
jgi:hypothetical protein